MSKVKKFTHSLSSCLRSNPKTMSTISVFVGQLLTFALVQVEGNVVYDQTSLFHWSP